jgi:subtilisin family serine protease
MKRLYSDKLSLVIVGLSIVIIAITTITEAFDVDAVEEYVLTVNNEHLHFIAQPEAGYVLKTRDEIGSMDSTSRFLKSAGDVEICPVQGLGRKGVSVIYNERPADENDKTIKSLGVHSEVQYAAPLFSSNGETIAIIPEIVVRVEPGTEIEQVQAICDMYGCKIIKRMEFTEQEYLIEVLGPDAEAVFVAVEDLSQAPEVEWACPNTAFQPNPSGQIISSGFTSGGRFYSDVLTQDANDTGVFPNDEYFSEQWYLYNTGQTGGTPRADIHAPEAWEITTGDPNIIIGLPDTGVDTNHPDLVDNLVPGYDFYDNDDLPDPAHDDIDDAHGTMCAGLVAAKGDNDIGVVGVAWRCKVMPIRIESAQGVSSDADIATAFRWMAAHGADVISNSWGFGAAVPITHSAIIDITKPEGLGRDGKGCVILDASGNSGRGDRVRLIGRYPEVMSVGATNHNDVLWSYSNHGAGLDLVAPSGPGAPTQETVSQVIWSTDIAGPDGYNTLTVPPGVPPYPYGDIEDYGAWGGGTSIAAPLAAGVAALILSVEPNLTNEEVRHFLTRSAKDLGDPGWDEYYGWGRVDARAALDMVLAKRADLNNNWKVDFEDLLILIESWGTDDPLADIAPASKRDGFVDEQDLELMMQYWQTEIPEMGLIE